jgi:uncharacterized Zn ribbon protein
MIQLDTRNGHDFGVVAHFNRVSSTLSDRDILEVILNKWADDKEIDEITDLLTDLQFHDCDGNPLSVDDMVVLLDESELVGCPPKRGQVLQVTNLIDSETNYIECNYTYEIFAHRLLKVTNP